MSKGWCDNGRCGATAPAGAHLNVSCCQSSSCNIGKCNIGKCNTAKCNTEKCTARQVQMTSIMMTCTSREKMQMQTAAMWPRLIAITAVTIIITAVDHAVMCPAVHLLEHCFSLDALCSRRDCAYSSNDLHAPLAPLTVTAPTTAGTSN